MAEDVVEMKKGQAARVPAGPDGCTISCLSGMLWLTQENDPADYIITTESAFRVSGTGITVMEAVSDCMVRITRGARERVHDNGARIVNRA